MKTQLNPAQTEAVTTAPSHQLILAGAGSGKTRVLVHRMAYLVDQGLANPFHLLAVTFTNKAAHEMRQRLERLLGQSVQHLMIGTFHGLAHRLLRTHWEAAGLNQEFQILDSDDQYRLIKRLQKDLHLDEDKWPPKQTQWFINQQKEQGVRPYDVRNHDHSYLTDTLIRVYALYEEHCQRSSLVDFAELLLRSLELLQNNADIRSHYQVRFKFILIDEFQDTNRLQYRWLSLLRSEHNFFTAVGDDDQSIYSWRGACIDNIHRFMHEFTPMQVIRLEQNYRSTQTILAAANAVIANNTDRMGKALWTDGDAGTPISLYPAFNERDEAYFIAQSIQKWRHSGREAREIAILYRSNAQSRVLEEQLIDKHIPYRIYGGLRFYERAEIKDAIAYLRLVTNRHDDAAFERIINTPTRGIGPNSLQALRELARERELSLWDALNLSVSERLVPARACQALDNFARLIEQLNNERRRRDLAELFALCLDMTGLREFHRQDSGGKGLNRVENLDELINAASQFHPDDNSLDPLAEFLAHVALESGGEEAAIGHDAVSLMTLHAAKGLEFPLVFICGMEEELFPHKMSLDGPNGLEEERRLCYVGITRAMEKLVLSYAESRRLYGQEKYHKPSRFLQEIPETLLHSERLRSKISRPKTFNQDIDDDFHQDINQEPLYLGQRVKHAKFGPGTLLNAEGQGANTRLHIQFDRAGLKWLVASLAQLERL
jgi:DNA helicase-2/ATP-dependent DNA helicase PcrA